MDIADPSDTAWPHLPGGYHEERKPDPCTCIWCVGDRARKSVSTFVEANRDRLRNIGTCPSSNSPGPLSSGEYQRMRMETDEYTRGWSGL